MILDEVLPLFAFETCENLVPYEWKWEASKSFSYLTTFSLLQYKYQLLLQMKLWDLLDLSPPVDWNSCYVSFNFSTVFTEHSRFEWTKNYFDKTVKCRFSYSVTFEFLSVCEVHVINCRRSLLTCRDREKIDFFDFFIDKAGFIDYRLKIDFVWNCKKANKTWTFLYKIQF